LARAAAASVTRLIHITTTVADIPAAVALLGARPNVWFACGLHPHDAKRGPDELAGLAELLRGGLAPAVRRRVVAVGETGLDFHYDLSPRDAQEHAFRAQLALAVELKLPVVIHARAAETLACDILREYPALAGRVVFHCFTGDETQARRVLDDGHWISFTGIVTFKKSAATQAVARLVPADRFFVETDSPYLSPEPVRNRRPCEPALVVHTGAYLARLRGVTIAELAAQTTANAVRFFGLSEGNI
jgi:TatD DNase family protein